MILQVSGRTDIVAYYTNWFIERLRAGYCFVRNPIYPTIVYRYDLRPQAIDAIIFCSKNYKFRLLQLINQELFKLFTVFML